MEPPRPPRLQPRPRDPYRKRRAASRWRAAARTRRRATWHPAAVSRQSCSLPSRDQRSGCSSACSWPYRRRPSRWRKGQRQRRPLPPRPWSTIQRGRRAAIARRRAPPGACACSPSRERRSLAGSSGPRATAAQHACSNSSAACFARGATSSSRSWPPRWTLRDRAGTRRREAGAGGFRDRAGTRRREAGAGGGSCVAARHLDLWFLSVLTHQSSLVAARTTGSVATGGSRSPRARSRVALVPRAQGWECSSARQGRRQASSVAAVALLRQRAAPRRLVERARGAKSRRVFAAPRG